MTARPFEADQEARKLPAVRAAMLGKDGAAVREVRQAERPSPAQVHHHPLIRELVSDMLSRARREAGDNLDRAQQTCRLNSRNLF